MISRGIPAQPIGPGGYCPFGEMDTFRTIDITWEPSTEIPTTTDFDVITISGSPVFGSFSVLVLFFVSLL